jgi:hypothetical protein
VKPPPQLGHTLAKTPSAQSAQKVHSYEQMRALVAAGGSDALQCSQVGRKSSTLVIPGRQRVLESLANVGLQRVRVVLA